METQWLMMANKAKGFSSQNGEKWASNAAAVIK